MRLSTARADPRPPRRRLDHVVAALLLLAAATPAHASDMTGMLVLFVGPAAIGVPFVLFLLSSLRGRAAAVGITLAAVLGTIATLMLAKIPSWCFRNGYLREPTLLVTTTSALILCVGAMIACILRLSGSRGAVASALGTIGVFAAHLAILAALAQHGWTVSRTLAGHGKAELLETQRCSVARCSSTTELRLGDRVVPFEGEPDATTIAAPSGPWAVLFSTPTRRAYAVDTDVGTSFDLGFVAGGPYAPATWCTPTRLVYVAHDTASAGGVSLRYSRKPEILVAVDVGGAKLTRTVLFTRPDALATWQTVLRFACGPGDRVAVLLAGLPQAWRTLPESEVERLSEETSGGRPSDDFGPVDLYAWSSGDGLVHHETWPERTWPGDLGDLDVRWPRGPSPTWCRRSRPYSADECIPPAPSPRPPAPSGLH